jgi:peptide/nickel transport system ATP-binding protein
MKKLNEETGTAILFITHDLGVVAELCHRIVVMYAGKVVEEGNVSEILSHPRHPYTKGLIRSIPRMDKDVDRLYSIPGNVPMPGSITEGCRFSPRCEYAMDQCRSELPELLEISPEHRNRCWMTSKI